VRHFCEQACRIGSDRFERPLTLREKLRLNLHLLICKACRNYLDALETLHRAMQLVRRSDTGSHRLSDSQREKISRSLQES